MKLKSFLKGTLAVAVLLLCVAFGYQFAHLQQRFNAPAIDQRARLKPQLVAAVDAADRAAVETARAKLREWQKAVMEKVDGDFLDWHFSYFEWRWSGAKWVLRRVTGGKDDADQQYFGEIAEAFTAKVMSPQFIDTAIDQMAKASAVAYYQKLADGVAAVREAAGESRALVDVELRNINLAGQSESGQKIYVTLHEVAARRATSARSIVELLKERFAPKLGELVQSAASRGIVSEEAMTLSAAAGVTVAGTAKKLGLAKATAAAVGVAASVACVVAVVAVHEWWSHSSHVNENRPRLRRLINESLTEFIEALLNEDGRFGSRIREVRGQIEASIESQGTIWGVINEQARRALSI